VANKADYYMPEAANEQPGLNHCHRFSIWLLFVFRADTEPATFD